MLKCAYIYTMIRHLTDLKKSNVILETENPVCKSVIKVVHELPTLRSIPF